MASGNGLPIEQTTWAMLPRKIRILIIVLAAFAVVILCWSSWEFANHMPDHDWIVLAALAIVTFPFCVWLPRTETIVTFGDTYLMAISLIYGPSICIVATALYACLSLISALRTANRFLFVFGFSVLVCDALIYSLAFQFIKPTAAHEISAYLLPAVIMALVSFLFTSLIAATAISWRHGNRISALSMRQSSSSQTDRADRGRYVRRGRSSRQPIALPPICIRSGTWVSTGKSCRYFAMPGTTGTDRRT